MAQSVTFRVSEDEENILKSYAKLYNKNISELIRNIIFERIEDEYDLKNFDKNYKEVEKGKWYSQEEVEKELGL